MLLNEYYFRSVIIYCDDVLIFTNGGWVKHIQEVKPICGVLGKVKARVKLENESRTRSRGFSGDATKSTRLAGGEEIY